MYWHQAFKKSSRIPYGHCGRSRFRNVERSRLHCGQRARVFASAIAEYPLHRKREIRNTPPSPTKITCGRWRKRPGKRQECRHIRRSGSGDRARHDRFLGSAGGRGYAAPGRVLLVVRPSGKRRGCGDYGTAHREKLEAIEWCGGVYSSEWGFSNCCTGCATIRRSAPN